MSRISQAVVLALCLVLVGCSGSRRQPEPRASVPAGPKAPAVPADVLSVPDAVPRVEPRGTRGNPPFYEVFGKRYYVMAGSEGWVERGTASWYGPGFHAASTSLGEPYDMYAMTAAHKTLPIPCYAEVTNLKNGRKVVVRINDRGPFVGDRIIDLSYTAAAKLDMLLAGTAPVEVRVLTPGRDSAGGTTPAAASTTPPPRRPAGPATSAPVGGSAASGGAAPMFIQVGVFADHENARRRVEMLQAAGVVLAGLEELPRNDRVLHRVRVGPFASVEEFDLNLKRLRELGIHDAHLLAN